jgi:hypothetical protein
MGFLARNHGGFVGSSDTLRAFEVSLLAVVLAAPARQGLGQRSEWCRPRYFGYCSAIAWLRLQVNLQPL